MRFPGREADSEEAFDRSSWDTGWTAPAALQMAELATAHRNLGLAHFQGLSWKRLGRDWDCAAWAKTPRPKPSLREL